MADDRDSQLEATMEMLCSDSEDWEPSPIGTGSMASEEGELTSLAGGALGKQSQPTILQLESG